MDIATAPAVISLRSPPPGHPAAVFCVAPRPLCGTETWEGEWLAGCHYARVDPGPDAAAMLAENLQLGARLIVYLDRSRLPAILAQHYRRLLENDHETLAQVLPMLETAPPDLLLQCLAEIAGDLESYGPISALVTTDFF